MPLFGRKPRIPSNQEVDGFMDLSRRFSAQASPEHRKMLADIAPRREELLRMDRNEFLTARDAMARDVALLEDGRAFAHRAEQIGRIQAMFEQLYYGILISSGQETAEKTKEAMSTERLLAMDQSQIDDVERRLTAQTAYIESSNAKMAALLKDMEK